MRTNRLYCCSPKSMRLATDNLDDEAKEGADNEANEDRVITQGEVDAVAVQVSEEEELKKMLDALGNSEIFLECWTKHNAGMRWPCSRLDRPLIACIILDQGSMDDKQKRKCINALREIKLEYPTGFSTLQNAANMCLFAEEHAAAVNKLQEKTAAFLKKLEGNTGRATATKDDALAIIEYAKDTAQTAEAEAKAAMKRACDMSEEEAKG